MSHSNEQQLGTQTGGDPSLALPDVPRGRHSQATQGVLAIFANNILELRSRVGFSFSARGWCYAAEPYGLLKGDFDKFQKMMTKLRTDGLLPMNITTADKSRAFFCSEDLDCESANDEVARIRRSVDSWVDHWTPFSFWDDKDIFLMMVVEKADLVSLFQPVCRKYHIPIANAKGWSDTHVRAEIIRKCRPHIDAERQAIVLYCGDFDPAGKLIGEMLLKNLLSLNGTYYDLSFDGGNGREDIVLQPGEIEVHRFGLNYDIIDRLGLSWIGNLKTGSDKKNARSLNDPLHKHFKHDYVQDYIRDYCYGYLNTDGLFETDSPRKCEANALVVNVDEGRKLCEKAILEYLTESMVAEHEAALEERRPELRAITTDVWFSGNGDGREVKPCV